MAINLNKVLQKANTLSELMVNKEKGETEDLIKASEKKILHIDGVDLITITNEDGEKENVFVFTVYEFENKFFFAGAVLKDKFMQIIFDEELFNGCYTDFYDTVAEQGIAIKFKQGKTKAKKPVTIVEFFDE